MGDQVVVEILDDQGILEIQCHGGRAAPLAVMHTLIQAGAARAEPGLVAATTAQSVIATQALEDLPLAATLKTAAILLDQADGALDREIAAIARLVVADREALVGRLKTLIQRSGIGLRLARGWTVALAGRPNVGKSRLMNAIIGRERALVDHRPGTTRDVVTCELALEGWPIELVDTAGEREAIDSIERQGIERARTARAHADLVLLVLDGSMPLEPSDFHLLSQPHQARIVVANKSDLPPAWSLDQVGVELAISAERGQGLGELARLIAERIVGDPPPAFAAVPFRGSHVQCIVDALDRVESGNPAEALARLARGG